MPYDPDYWPDLALEQEAEIERLKTALRPFAMAHRINSGYLSDDFRRASDCFPPEPVIICQQQGGAK